MDMENKFKLKIPSMLRSSFSSCRSKNINDVVEKPVFLPQNRQHYQLIDLFSPKPQPFLSTSSPKCQENLQAEGSRKDDENTLLVAAHFNGRKCPPASPISPLNPYPTYYQECKTKPPKQKKHTKKPTSKKTRPRNRSCQMYDFPECKYNGLFSNDEDEDEDDDKTTFFSSRSLTSDSSESFRRQSTRKNRGSSQTRPRRVAGKEAEAASEMPLKGRVKGSFAVVKSSSDPYDDFRTSMVEMIVERQIFGAQDLENMLHCFLSLNSHHHHRAIIEVFTEIWEALFSNWY